MSEQAERDRAEQIADDQRERDAADGPRPCSPRQQRITRIRRPSGPPTMVRTTRPCSRASSNGVFLALRLQLVAVEHPGHVGIEHDQVGRRARPQRAARQAEQLGGPRRQRLEQRHAASSSPLWTRRRPAGSRVSRPIAPARGLGEGQALGLDVLRIVVGHDDVDQAVARAPRPAPARSSSARSGGDSLKKVR